MIKLSTILSELIKENALMQFGLSYNLINLSQVAKFIHPMLEVRCKKEISHTSILMSLSRIQRRLEKIAPKTDNFSIKNLSINTDLCVFTYFKNIDVHKQLNTIYQKIQSKKSYFNFTESSNEITVITDRSSAHYLENDIKDIPKNIDYNVAAIGIRFDESYVNTPGFIYMILQKMTLQGINLVEIGSTYTELILYIDNKDVKLAFDTLYHCFAFEG